MIWAIIAAFGSPQIFAFYRRISGLEALNGSQCSVPLVEHPFDLFIHSLLMFKYIFFF